MGTEESGLNSWGGKAADPYSAETPAPRGDSHPAGTEPADLIRGELIAAGYKIMDVHENGERFIEHSTIIGPAGSKTEDNEVCLLYTSVPFVPIAMIR